MAAQEQAQATRQQNITYSDSLELVRCLLRVSVFHISYLRGLFPDDHFKGVDMHNLDGMNIKMLQANCEESRRLIDWVEGGVYDAIRKGYLSKLMFGIALDPEGRNLLEEYIFNFMYAGEDGTVAMDLIKHNGRTGAKQSLHRSSDGRASGGNTVSHVKYQVTRLMRMLVQICQTLDKVPQERYLFMKLSYHPHTPDEYEPPYFVAVDPQNAIGQFNRKPFEMNVGNVNTSHHGLIMNIKSTLDCCEDDQDDVMEPEQVASGGAVPATTVDSPLPDMCPRRSVASQRLVEASPAPEVTEAQYQAVKKYVTRCFETFDQLDLTDVMASFTDIKATTLEQIFVRLRDDGFVEADSTVTDRFLPGPKLKSLTAARQAQKAADKLAGDMADQLAVQPAKTASKATRGAAAETTTRQTRAQKAAPQPVLLASQDAVMAACGSELTGQGKALTRPAGIAEAPMGSQPPAHVYVEEAKRSGAVKTRTRKASYVADPIYQRPAKETKKAKRGA